MKKIPGLPTAFGTVIAELRTEQKMKQEELAEAIDSTNVYISMLETGMRQPSLNTTILIARELHMEPGVLVARVVAMLEHNDTQK